MEEPPVGRICIGIESKLRNTPLVMGRDLLNVQPVCNGRSALFFFFFFFIFPVDAFIYFFIYAFCSCHTFNHMSESGRQDAVSSFVFLFCVDTISIWMIVPAP